MFKILLSKNFKVTSSYARNIINSAEYNLGEQMER